MFLPISDAPNPKGRAVATWALIAVNVGIYLLVSLPLGLQPADTADPAMAEYLELLSQQVHSRQQLIQAARSLSAYDLFVFKHGFRPAHPSLADLLFSMFLHGGLLHLLGNMLFLWIYGDNVEHRLGPVRFVFWYLATGSAATLFHALIFHTSGVPLVGASGAISGVLGFYFVWFPKNTVRVLFFLPPFFWYVFEIPARVVLGIYLVIDNLLPLLFAGAGGVAHGAHIGGFIAGTAAAWLLARRGADRAVREVAPPVRPRPSSDPVRDALRSDRLGDAASTWFELPRDRARAALNGDEALELAERLRRAGHSRAALAVLQRTLELTPPGSDAAELSAQAGLILLEDAKDPTAAYQYLVRALRSRPSPATAAVVRRALAAIEARQRLHPGGRPPGV